MNIKVYVLMIIMALFLTLDPNVSEAKQYYASCEPKVGGTPIDGPNRDSYEDAEKDAKKMRENPKVQGCTVENTGLGSS
jgi:hypothetical protein